MDIDVAALKVEHNEARHRFEVRSEHSIAVAEYRREGSRIVFTHTEVPESWEGKGIASKLVTASCA